MMRRLGAQVYVEKPGQDKPELGEGLNKPAEVTLYNVFKRDKETGEPLKDPASVEAYRKRLMRLSAGQRSRFRDYNADTGTWRFEVEHFSRCACTTAATGGDMQPHLRTCPLTMRLHGLCLWLYALWAWSRRTDLLHATLHDLTAAPSSDSANV